MSPSPLGEVIWDTVSFPHVSAGKIRHTYSHASLLPISHHSGWPHCCQSLCEQAIHSIFHINKVANLRNGCLSDPGVLILVWNNTIIISLGNLLVSSHSPFFHSKLRILLQVSSPLTAWWRDSKQTWKLDV